MQATASRVGALTPRQSAAVGPCRRARRCVSVRAEGADSVPSGVVSLHCCRVVVAADERCSRCDHGGIASHARSRHLQPCVLKENHRAIASKNSLNGSSPALPSPSMLCQKHGCILPAAAGTEKKETKSLEMMRKFSEQYAQRCGLQPLFILIVLGNRHVCRSAKMTCAFATQLVIAPQDWHVLLHGLVRHSSRHSGMA